MSEKQGFSLEYEEPVAEHGRARRSCAKRATRAAINTGTCSKEIEFFSWGCYAQWGSAPRRVGFPDL